MQKLLVQTVLAWAFHLTASAATIVSWNFNSAVPDSDPATGSITASFGNGKLTFIGGTTNLFGEVGGGTSSDPEVDDDTQLRITRPPAQGTNNKSAGLQIELATRGFEQLQLGWSQYNSATASRYWRVLLSTNGVDWIEHTVIAQTNAAIWRQHAVSLHEYSAFNNSDSVFLRIVSEFESTATGTSADEYRAVRDDSTYSTSGSCWIDVLSISGRAIGGVYWDFNSKEVDLDSGTGTLEPTHGTGELRLIGVGSQSFGTVGQGNTSDFNTTDNSMLRLSGFPPQGTADRTAGIEIFASTVGLQRISLTWDQYNSATASRYFAIQYTTNGTDFIEHAIVTNTAASAWLRAREVNLANVPGVENKENFGIRLVSTFGPNGSYEPVSPSSSYSTAGTLWLDMVSISGEPTNRAPALACNLLTGEVVLSWPLIFEGYALEALDEFGAEWFRLEVTPGVLNEILQVRLPNEGTQRFYRLRELK